MSPTEPSPLRPESVTRPERSAQGRAIRRAVPRSGHAEWTVVSGRPVAVELLKAAAASRVPELVPVRHERMRESAFAFFRGMADLMARDLAQTPSSGLRVQACGDAHVGNFGQFATPERNIVFDINDFDETLPGPWEWDLKRLLTSLELVMRAKGVPPAQRRRLTSETSRTYRKRLAGYGSQRTLEVWYSQIDIGQVLAMFSPPHRRLMRRDIDRARRRTNLAALTKLTQVVDGHRQFLEQPPLLVRLERTGHDMDEVLGLVEGYRLSLSEDLRELLDRFRLVDVARKVVGVGSVGTRCWVGLLEGPHHPAEDPLFLQMKEAGPSVLEQHLRASALGHHGLRVVTGQRLTQATSDVLLGWSEGPRSGRAYYVRQLWDVKGSGDPLAMAPTGLLHYSRLCAWALARAHARTGDAVAIAGYLGRSDRFDRAAAEFASRYADQSEADYAVFLEAIRSDRLPVSRPV